MIQKRILPEGFNFDVPSVEIIDCGKKGLDKTAMLKRASAFDDVLESLVPQPKRVYLHVITTGAYEKYGPNRNCFVAGTPVCTPMGVVPIESLVPGDLVYSSDGVAHRVLNTMSRKYSGKMITVKVQGIPEPVTMTADHPVLVTECVEGARLDIEPSQVYILAKDICKDRHKVLIPEIMIESLGLEKIYTTRTHVQALEELSTFDITDTIVYDITVEDTHNFCVPFVVHNCDAWNEKSFDVVFPEPEDPKHTHEKLDDGLSKYHDSTYMKGGHVYQEHNTKDTDPSGEVIAAKYNPDMHRGELIIAVDTEKWAPRLQRKAKGQDIFLSIGASVPRDLCMVCGRSAKTASEHCDHFKHHRMQVLDNGARCCVMNDTPSFYDISGVDVPADRIAFVLRKVASGEQAKTAMLDAITTLGSRTPMLLTKAARVLGKLAQMEKRIEGMVEGDEPALSSNPDAEKTFVVKVINYPSDEIIDCCNSKGLLLSPGMLFKLLAKDSDNPEAFDGCDDNCCGDCSTLLRDFEEDEDRNTELLDGSFDQHFLPDVNLANIIESFLPELGMSNPAVQSRSIHIIIAGKPKTKTQDKEASYNPQATEALRRTYARYVVSFAERNDDATCMNALRKLATYGRR